MNASQWIGPLIGLLALIAGALIGHAVSDAKWQGKTDAELRELREKLGNRETGLMGQVHKQATEITKLGALWSYIKDRLRIKTGDDE
jgi:hypothetical protein